MQQHTGQHILSQAFIQIAEAETVGFHLTPTVMTIDLDRTDMSEAEISAVEQRANEAVWANYPVTVRFVSQDEVASLSLRKVPPVRNGRLRLIDIENFDLTACGGTHVSHTGSVGLIKIVKHEKRGEKTRIEFCCGNRAVQDYAQKHTIVNDLTTELTTGAAEIIQSISKIRQENKEAQRTIKKQKEALMAFEAQQYIATGIQIGPATLIKQTFAEDDVLDLRALAAQLTKQDNIILLLGQAGKRTQLFFSRSSNVPGDMAQLLKVALTQLGDGGGGGSPNSAQGGGPAHTYEEVADALDAVQSALITIMSN
jgi:alanyl-tRNA synthetase